MIDGPPVAPTPSETQFPIASQAVLLVVVAVVPIQRSEERKQLALLATGDELLERERDGLRLGVHASYLERVLEQVRSIARCGRRPP